MPSAAASLELRRDATPKLYAQADRLRTIQEFFTHRSTPMAEIKPMFDRVIVKRVEVKTTTPGGIIIPETAQDKTQTGHVVAIGAGKLLADGQLRPLSVKPGSKVLFGKYAGTEITIDGEELVILREDELLGEFCDTAQCAPQQQTCC